MDLSRVTLQMVLKQRESSLLINLRLTSSAATKLGMKIALACMQWLYRMYIHVVYTVLGKALSDPLLTYPVWVVNKR